MDKTIDKQIQELIDDSNECQKKVRDQSLSAEAIMEARNRIQNNWYEITRLRKEKAKMSEGEQNE